MIARCWWLTRGIVSLRSSVAQEHVHVTRSHTVNLVVYDSGFSYIIINISWKQCLNIFVLRIHLIRDQFWTRWPGAWSLVHYTFCFWTSVELITCLSVVKILFKVHMCFSGVPCLFRKFADCFCNLCLEFWWLSDGLCGLVDRILLLFSVEW
jgi:hypothetical protein